MLSLVLPCTIRELLRSSVDWNCRRLLASETATPFLLSFGMAASAVKFHLCYEVLTQVLSAYASQRARISSMMLA